MRSGIILLGIFILTLSCAKEREEAVKTPTQMLTQKTWKLVSHGYDRNGNGIIDASEEEVQNCETDNSYAFYNDGSGLFRDNLLSCSTGLSEFWFDWTFTDGERALDFLYATVNIHKLNEEELITYNEQNDHGQIVRYINVFHH